MQREDVRWPVPHHKGVEGEGRGWLHHLQARTADTPCPQLQLNIETQRSHRYQSLHVIYRVHIFIIAMAFPALCWTEQCA